MIVAIESFEVKCKNRVKASASENVYYYVPISRRIPPVLFCCVGGAISFVCYKGARFGPELDILYGGVLECGLPAH